MILYVWIKKYKNLEKIGFNLTSRYEFNFKYDEKGEDISGNLTVKNISSSEIFNDYLWDLKAIIGKNGTGKSSMIFATIQSILTDHRHYFNGFIVTDKYIFNRNNIKILYDKEIEKLNLVEVKNADIYNFNRSSFEKKQSEEEVKNLKGYRVIESYLSDHAFFYYSPLINYDRVHESEDIVAGYQTFEVNFDYFFDLSTEAQIVFDTDSFSPFDYMDLKSGSELLCHKSKESERILEFILNEKNKINFDITIPFVTIHLNQFSINYWESIARILKKDNEIEGPLLRYIERVRFPDKRNSDWHQFEDNLAKNFLLFALKYEVNHKYNFHSQKNKGNAVTDTIQAFESVAIKQRTIKGMLKAYLTKSSFYKDDYPVLYNQIDKLISFLKRQSKASKITINHYSFDIPFQDKNFFNKFLKLSYKFYGFREKSKDFETPDLGFSIFSYEFSGLSSGEKSILHLLSRFDHYLNRLSGKTKDIVIFLDEPDVALHPQWQKELITILVTYFKNKLKKEYKVQLIITGHSPIIISDLPNENIVFLDKNKKTKKTIVSELTDIQNTFAANIHALYSDAFFIQNGTIADFAKEIIKDVISILTKKTESRKTYAAKIINLIGDELIKQQLKDLYEKSFGLQVETIDEEIARLQQELEYAKKQKEKNENS